MNSALNHKLSQFIEDSPAYWDEIIQQYMKIRRGITQSEFCKAKEIALSTFKRELYASPYYVAPNVVPSVNESGSFREAAVVADNIAESAVNSGSTDKDLLLTFSKNDCDYTLRIPPHTTRESLVNIFSCV